MQTDLNKPTQANKLLQVEQFLQLFEENSFIHLAKEKIKAGTKNTLHLKGLKGSLDAIVASQVYSFREENQIFILHDKEEAAYFQNDLQNLLPDQEVLFFPTSYKKPYEFLEVENANILQRADTLNMINQQNDRGTIVVTYPEAMTEKVINQKSLVEHTLSAKIGEKIDMEFISELLSEYDFERTDFVYEAGQYAVRGGIIDIFSYANDLPYRLELFDDEIESIRTFDPLTQLSVETKEHVSIIPNVQTKLLKEVRESFLSFIPTQSIIWFKDYDLTLDVLSKSFEKAQADFQEIVKQAGDTQVITDPEELFETKEGFQTLLEKFSKIEFGNRFYLPSGDSIAFESQPQPSFNKNFNLLVENLDQYQAQDYINLISAESLRQLNQLKLIFEEIDPGMNFKEINLGLRAGFIDETSRVVCYTDHQLFERFHRYHAKKKYSKTKALTLKELNTLNIGDYVTHIDYGIGRFGGLEKIDVGGNEQEAVRLIFRDNDLLYISVHSLHKISKYSGQEGKIPNISKLGSPEWEQKKRKVKKKVKDIAKDLINLYAQRKQSQGLAFSPDNYLQAELESSFIYEDTPDQAKATQEVKEDMELPHPMDRLVCGDVGFGKTEVAIRAAFKAVCESKQVAVLVPTTILAMQHHHTFTERLKNFPCTVAYVNRFKSSKEIRETLKETAEGKVDILIGTHRITSKDVNFKDLGLLIVDEEQKFGVSTKEKIKKMKVNVDVLTLTATPIPRTLHFSLMGARDLSIISTPPPNRQPVTTKLHNFSDALVRDAISEELQRGGQVFFVHNRVHDIEKMANNILALVPDARVAYAHGQMEGKRLEKIMGKFIEGEYDILVSTNIIESGLDIPNANTIIINHAHMFGLSDLHQMRGRVGRSNKKAYCYLLTPSLINLTAEARKRLSALEEFSDLGAGFNVAMRDLDIRGAGNLLGAEQSGFISDLGFDMYNKVLTEAVNELKETEFKELFPTQTPDLQSLRVECTIETDLEILIPEDYVTNISERLSLYIKADEVKSQGELEKFHKDLIDRFGPLPQPVTDLLESIKLRWLAEKLGMEKLLIKNGKIKAYLLSQNHAEYYQSEAFSKILAYVKSYYRACSLKEAKNKVILTLSDIHSIHDALICLRKIDTF
ncbi:transcription-repair coupling factor [Rapidithrix thailandica]|uniref:Transcription-repair-coupling factor n=1 Tax=Rapidithrix thailandica TaxID=413964 RepID=A0AAW9SBC0_9BACT